LITHRRLYQAGKQRMRPVGAAFKLGMKLNAYKKPVLGQFNRLNQRLIRGHAA
jgi:hypothetical protein